MLCGMAVSGTVPARRQPAFDPQRVARWLRRGTALIAVVGFVWLVMRYSTAWVPAGMDTVPGLPPGSWCIIDRHPALRVGADVFVDAPGGRIVSRIAAVDDTTVTVLHPNSASSVPDSRTFGPLARTQVHGTVLVVFAADGEVPRGR